MRSLTTDKSRARLRSFSSFPPPIHMNTVKTREECDDAVKAALKDNTNVKEADMHKHLLFMADLGLDSLDVHEVTMRIETATGVPIEDYEKNLERGKVTIASLQQAVWDAAQKKTAPPSLE